MTLLAVAPVDLGDVYAVRINSVGSGDAYVVVQGPLVLVSPADAAVLSRLAAFPAERRDGRTYFAIPREYVTLDRVADTATLTLPLASFRTTDIFFGARPRAYVPPRGGGANLAYMIESRRIYTRTNANIGAWSAMLDPYTETATYSGARATLSLGRIGAQTGLWLTSNRAAERPTPIAAHGLTSTPCVLSEYVAGHEVQSFPIPVGPWSADIAPFGGVAHLKGCGREQIVDLTGLPGAPPLGTMRYSAQLGSETNLFLERSLNRHSALNLNGAVVPGDTGMEIALSSGSDKSNFSIGFAGSSLGFGFLASGGVSTHRFSLSFAHQVGYPSQFTPFDSDPNTRASILGQSTNISLGLPILRNLNVSGSMYAGRMLSGQYVHTAFASATYAHGPLVLNVSYAGGRTFEANITLIRNGHSTSIGFGPREMTAGLQGPNASLALGSNYLPTLNVRTALGDAYLSTTPTFSGSLAMAPGAVAFGRVGSSSLIVRGPRGAQVMIDGSTVGTIGSRDTYLASDLSPNQKHTVALNASGLPADASITPTSLSVVVGQNGTATAIFREHVTLSVQGTVRVIDAHGKPVSLDGGRATLGAISSPIDADGFADFEGGDAGPQSLRIESPSGSCVTTIDVPPVIPATYVMTCHS